MTLKKSTFSQLEQNTFFVVSEFPFQRKILPHIFITFIAKIKGKEKKIVLTLRLTNSRDFY
jgi:hypothetical protein